MILCKKQKYRNKEVSIGQILNTNEVRGDPEHPCSGLGRCPLGERRRAIWDVILGRADAIHRRFGRSYVGNRYFQLKDYLLLEREEIFHKVVLRQFTCNDARIHIQSSNEIIKGLQPSTHGLIGVSAIQEAHLHCKHLLYDSYRLYIFASLCIFAKLVQ